MMHQSEHVASNNDFAFKELHCFRCRDGDDGNDDIDDDDNKMKL